MKKKKKFTLAGRKENPKRFQISAYVGTVIGFSSGQILMQYNLTLA
jgi:hypothetical protein